MPDDIAPVDAPFQIQDLQRPEFPDGTFDIRDYGAREMDAMVVNDAYEFTFDNMILKNSTEERYRGHFMEDFPMEGIGFEDGLSEDIIKEQPDFQVWQFTNLDFLFINAIHIKSSGMSVNAAGRNSEVSILCPVKIKFLLLVIVIQNSYLNSAFKYKY